MQRSQRRRDCREWELPQAARWPDAASVTARAGREGARRRPRFIGLGASRPNYSAVAPVHRACAPVSRLLTDPFLPRQASLPSRAANLLHCAGHSSPWDC